MIQQFRKINILTTAAMLVTFSASVALVTLTTPTKTSVKKCDQTATFWMDFNKTKTETLPCLDSWPSALLDQISGVFRSQPDSPIRFIGYGGAMTMTSTDVGVTNLSNRTIRAFAVGHRGEGLKEVDGKARLEGLWDPDLEPGETRMISVYWHWRELWIDFVEFSDGSTWGPNEMNSRQTLEANRAGMRDATSRFTKILEKDGPDALIASLRKKITIPQSQMRDSDWNEDFQSAFGGVCYELQRAQEEVFSQFGPGDGRKAALRDKFSAILSTDAESANPGLPGTNFRRPNRIEVQSTGFSLPF